eukprot:TRINITY_DN23763_c0_g1_i1.p1 TRINITY_DN23763_c0_g1~~TRINITY_DN23763_c0_g1_i1.p1  ORF type:complete len:151 (+),score=18.99 TRINITY_DN23763_c0_g1_i1:29-481(+)
MNPSTSPTDAQDATESPLLQYEDGVHCLCEDAAQGARYSVYKEKERLLNEWLVKEMRRFNVMEEELKEKQLMERQQLRLLARHMMEPESSSSSLQTQSLPAVQTHLTVRSPPRPHQFQLGRPEGGLKPSPRSVLIRKNLDELIKNSKKDN